MLLYVGPDQIIPFTGVIGAVIGVALIFWGKVVQAVRKLFGLLSSRQAAGDEPHQ